MHPEDSVEDPVPAEEHPAGSVTPAWGLWVLETPDRRLHDRVLPLTQEIILGRNVPDGLLVVDPRLSREHARIYPGEWAGSWMMVDLGSTHGTRVDGTSIDQPVLLAPGAVIRAGSTLLEFNSMGEAAPVSGQGELIGRSPAFRAFLAQIDGLAASTAPALLLGEAGTGKALAARLMHTQSGRTGAFISVDCSAINEDQARQIFFAGPKAATPGLLHQARGGTLYLARVHTLPRDLQPALMDVLDSGRYLPFNADDLEPADASLICSTGADLAALAASKQFFGELYTRLASHSATIPVLRERRADIPLIVRHYLAEHAGERSVRCSTDLLEKILLRPWNGNLRQLNSIMHQLVRTAEAREQKGPMILKLADWRSHGA